MTSLAHRTPLVPCRVEPAPDVDDTSLLSWAELYFQAHVTGSPKSTRTAKIGDLRRFIRYFAEALGHQHVDGWTPSVTKAFQRDLAAAVSPRTGRPLKATTVNRTMATVRHFARWLQSQRPLLAGNPLAGVRDLMVDEPAWKGLSRQELTRLSGAIDQRLNGCTRKDQNPRLEAAVFYVLLHTGLRAHELCRLDLSHYRDGAFHQVKRKGARVSTKVLVPSAARAHLDDYLEARGDTPGPLLLSRYGRRLSTKELDRLCARIANQANAQATDGSSVRLTPHQLRHSFLKRVACRPPWRPCGSTPERQRQRT
jgi:integrase/recombinase XerD